MGLSRGQICFSQNCIKCSDLQRNLLFTDPLTSGSIVKKRTVFSRLDEGSRFAKKPTFLLGHLGVKFYSKLYEMSKFAIMYFSHSCWNGISSIVFTENCTGKPLGVLQRCYFCRGCIQFPLRLQQVCRGCRMCNLSRLYTNSEKRKPSGNLSGFISFREKNYNLL